MYRWNLSKFITANNIQKNNILLLVNNYLNKLTAIKRITWALNNLPHQAVLSSSFGIQSSVSLHLLTTQKANIPIILIDTGYLFQETYNFIDQLTNYFKLNLKIFRASHSPAWQEARYGKLWTQGLKGIEFYNKINKIEPMKHALSVLKVGTWFAGLRRQQSETRSNLSILSMQQNIFKFLPIVDWDNQQIHDYMQTHNLEYHPLREKGYISIGDIHTTSKFTTGMKQEETRFFGLKRECGIHIK